MEKVRQETQKRLEDGLVGLSPSLDDVVVTVPVRRSKSAAWFCSSGRARTTHALAMFPARPNPPK